MKGTDNPKQCIRQDTKTSFFLFKLFLIIFDSLSPVVIMITQRIFLIIQMGY
jgi:hypothetical protein